jgi:hypothetical protein
VIIYDFLAVLIIAGVVYGIFCLFNWARTRLDSNRTDAVDLRKQLRESHAQINKDERVLRSIANGSGSPVLEAQIGLDEITAYFDSETKELNV